MVPRACWMIAIIQRGEVTKKRRRFYTKKRAHPARAGSALSASVVIVNSLVDGLHGVATLVIAWIAIEAGPTCNGAGTIADRADGIN